MERTRRLYGIDDFYSDNPISIDDNVRSLEQGRNLVLDVRPDRGGGSRRAR